MGRFVKVSELNITANRAQNMVQPIRDVFKMVYEHYYKYMKDDRAGGKFMENYRELQKETPAKLSQNGHTLQGPIEKHM
jgi:hypothetical protein